MFTLSFNTCAGPEQKTRPGQFQFYVRHWRPSSYTVDPTQEIIVNSVLDKQHIKEKVGTY